jgi:CRISPR-associated endoribonuclease Cas6
MLRAFVLGCIVDRKTVLPAIAARQIYAAVLRLLRERDPEMAARLHDGPGPKPITVSGPEPAEERGGWVELRPGMRYEIRITALTSEVGHALFEVLRVGRILAIAGAGARVTEVALTNAEHPLAAMTSYEPLYRHWFGGSPPTTVSMVFRSPTVLSNSAGDAEVSFPDPARIFGGLSRRWNLFAPQVLHMDRLLWEALTVGARLVTASLEFREVEVPVKKGRLPRRTSAFLGTAEFGIHDEQYLRMLHLLTHFAEFSGVGTFVTRGMGQVSLGRHVEQPHLPGVSRPPIER